MKAKILPLFAAVALVAMGLGMAAMGCSGGSSGGGGGAPVSTPPPPPPPTPSGSTEAVMLDVRTGQPGPTATAVTSPGRVFFGVSGHQYTLNLDTTPTGQALTLTVGRLTTSGGVVQTLNEQVTTPVTRVISPAASEEGLYAIQATALSGVPVEFSRISVLASNQEANTTS